MPPITDVEELAEHIDAVIGRPSIERDESGKSFYYDDASGTIVIVNPSVPYGGTAYVGDEDEFWRAH